MYRTPTAIIDKSVTGNKSISCLAAYGGPVDPNVALGGFPRKQQFHFVILKVSYG